MLLRHGRYPGWNVEGELLNGEMMKVGIIGFGDWPRQAYAPLLPEMPEVQVVAVAARSNSTRELAKQIFGPNLRTFDNYHDLLNAEAVDAVLIALPNSQHGEGLEAAAKSNKHLFFEPPIAGDAETATRVLDALAEAEGVVQANLELRYLPVMDAVLARLQSGMLGQPLMAKICLWCDWGYKGGSWFDEVQAESFFLWLGAWYLDVLDCVFEAEATQARVVGSYSSNGTLMDHGWASLAYHGGGIGQFEFNLVVPQDTIISLSVACQAGELVADLQMGKWRWRGESGDWHHDRCPASMPTYGFVGMRESLQDFFGAIRTGSTPRANIDVVRRVQRASQLCADAE